MIDDRRGAKQPRRFDPTRAILLDDPARFEYLPPQLIFDLLDAPQGASVIDLGTGTGAFALRLALARPDLTVIALDEQPEMLELLKKKLSAAPLPNVKPFLADLKGLATLRGRAERILALNVLHELGDEALAQAAALLKADGMAVFVDWNAEVDRPVGPPREHVLSCEEGIAKLKAGGLTAVRQHLFRYHYALVCRR